LFISSINLCYYFMKRILSLALLLLAPCAHAAGRFEIALNPYVSSYRVHMLGAGGRAMVPVSSWSIRRVTPSGFSFGLKYLRHCPIEGQSLEPLMSAILPAMGDQAALLTPFVGVNALRLPLPSAYMVEATLPLFSPGAFNLNASFALGFADWSHLPGVEVAFPEGSIPGCDFGGSFEVRVRKWTLACGGLINFDWNLGESFLLRASAGYMSFGRLSIPVIGSLSAGGMTFGLGLGFKL
jgi:hypothetical protein